MDTKKIKMHFSNGVFIHLMFCLLLLVTQYAVGQDDLESGVALNQLKTRALNDKSEVRREAVRRMAAYHASNAVDVFKEHLDDEDLITRGYAVEGLISANAVETFVVALKSTDPDIRRRAVQALARINGQGVIDHILEMAGDPDPSVSYEAVLILSREDGHEDRIKNSTAYQTFMSWLSGKNYELFVEAVNAFIKMDQVKPFETMTIMGQPLSGLYRIDALCKIGGPRAKQGLVNALRFLNPIVRQKAATALLRMGVSEPFYRLLESENSLHKITAIRAIGETGDSSAADVIKPFVESEDWRIRCYAVEALGRLGAKHQIDYILSRAGRDKNVFVRAFIFNTLTRLGLNNKALQDRTQLMFKFGRGDPFLKVPVIHFHGSKEGYCWGELIIAEGVFGFINLDNSEPIHSFGLGETLKIRAVYKAPYYHTFREGRIQSITVDNAELIDVDIFHPDKRILDHYTFITPYFFWGNTAISMRYHDKEHPYLESIFELIQEKFGLTASIYNGEYTISNF